MDKLSGLVLDVYDDNRGEVLRSVFPSREAIPETVKEAQYLSEDVRRSLPDDLFALVIRDGDVTLRKYACVDQGNTVLSISYFLKEGHKLPKEAQKVAASNLLVASDWYGIPRSPELEKTAFIGALLGRAAGAIAGGAANLVGRVASRPVGNMVVNKAKTMGTNLLNNPIQGGLNLLGKTMMAKSVMDTGREISSNLRAAKGVGGMPPTLPTGQQALTGI